VSATASRPQRNGCIAIIECGNEIAALIRDDLSDAGFLVETVGNDTSYDRHLCHQPEDLIVLDWALPNRDARELLEKIRKRPTTFYLPIVVVTYSADESEIVRAYELGADAVVSRPFSVKEFVARVEALVRRSAMTRPSDVVIAGDIELNRDSMRVRRRDKIVKLAAIDYRLLELFLQNPGQVLGRKEIIDNVWGEDYPVDDRTINVHVGRLRKALLSTSRRDPIKTVRGAGYRLNK
jgi:two-component system, OmpR family, phosphate regulon response regulator PhoB